MPLDIVAGAILAAGGVGAAIGGGVPPTCTQCTVPHQINNKNICDQWGGTHPRYQRQYVSHEVGLLDGSIPKPSSPPTDGVSLYRLTNTSRTSANTVSAFDAVLSKHLSRLR